jgi:hypothetical protein
MTTTPNFKDLLDLPEWRTLANAPGSTAAGSSMAYDLRNDISNHPNNYFLRAATGFDLYSPYNDEWMTLGSPAMAGTFGAGACAYFMPSCGPRGTLAAGCTTSQIILSTALPNAVGVNQLSDRSAGRGVGFKVRIIGNAAGSSGKIEERFCTANTSGTTPTIILDTPLSFTPASGDAYEFLSGRVFLFSAGTTAAGVWKYYDILTNSYSGNLSTTNLPATISTDTAMVGLDELHVPYNRSPGEGFLGVITSTATAAGTITGSAAGGDAAILTNEYRNFQVRIVEDTTTPTSVGQRRWISSHTAGASPVYTLSANWTVTPSSGAKFVIENTGVILAFTTALSTVYTYFPYAIGAGAADSWSSGIFAARGSAVGAGVMGWQSFGIAPDATKNVRHSMIYSFRGGAIAAVDVLDIAGGATGSWSNSITFGNYSGVLTITTGSSGCYAPATQEGRYFYFNQNGTQRNYRFDCLNRVLEPFCYLRYAQGTAVVGERLSMSLFIDGSTKLSLIQQIRGTGAEQFQVLVTR